MCSQAQLAEELGWDRPVAGCWWWTRRECRIPDRKGVVFVFDGGVVDEADVARMVFADGEIVSAAFHTLAQAREKVKPR